jgi:integrase/recombinase XerD
MDVYQIRSKKYKAIYKGFNDMVVASWYAPRGRPFFLGHAKEFLHFLEDRKVFNIRKVRPIDLMNYDKYLHTRRKFNGTGGLSPYSIRNQWCCIRKMFKYLLQADEIKFMPIIPIFHLKTAESRKIPTANEIKQIYAVCETKRDRALLSAAYGCGLRKSEINRLNIKDIAIHKRLLIIRNSKGGQHREVPMSNVVVQDFKNYLRQIQPTKETKSHLETPFFITKTGSRWQSDSLYKRFKILLHRTENKRLINKRVSLHSLRHAIATHLMNNGAELEFVQGFLGHSHVNSSHWYSKKRKSTYDF